MVITDVLEQTEVVRKITYEMLLSDSDPGYKNIVSVFGRLKSLSLWRINWITLQPLHRPPKFILRNISTWPTTESPNALI